MLFYPPKGTENHFLACAYLDGSVYMSLDARLATLFPPELVNATTKRWQAIRIGHGAVPTSENSVVGSISTSLARSGIPILLASTAHTDYFLVEHGNLLSAARVLASTYPISIFLETDYEVSEIRTVPVAGA